METGGGYDLIYIDGYIRGALPIMRKAHAPCIIHHHVVTDLLHDGSINGSTIVDKAAEILFVSDFAANFAKTGNEKQNAKMHSFPNSIDTSKFCPENNASGRTDIRGKYGISNDDIVVLFVGRMVEGKGAYEVICAMNSLKSERCVKLIVAGGATYNSKKQSPYVKKCLAAAGKNKNIIFSGSIDYENVPKYYAAADIAVLISRCDEACGLVGIEAMASGIPVITTGRGGIPEYVSEKCSITVADDAGLIENLAMAIDTLSDNETLRKDMGKHGLETAARFSKSVYYRNFSDIVYKIVGKENCCE